MASSIFRRLTPPPPPHLFPETDKAVDRTTDWDFLESILKINSRVKLQIRIEDVRAGFENNKTAFEGSALRPLYDVIIEAILDGLSSRIAMIRLQNSWRFMLGQKNILRALESMNLDLLKGSKKRKISQNCLGPPPPPLQRYIYELPEDR